MRVIFFYPHYDPWRFKEVAFLGSLVTCPRSHSSVSLSELDPVPHWPPSQTDRPLRIPKMALPCRSKSCGERGVFCPKILIRSPRPEILWLRLAWFGHTPHLNRSLSFSEGCMGLGHKAPSSLEEAEYPPHWNYQRRGPVPGPRGKGFGWSKPMDCSENESWRQPRGPGINDFYGPSPWRV